MTDSAIFTTQAQQIVAASHFLYGQGWSPATSSNYSARIDDERIAITVSGRHKGELTEADVMVVDLQGQPVKGRAVNSTAKSSAETLLHTVLYNWAPAIGAVLHTHSVNATVFSRLMACETACYFQDYELQKAFPGVNSHSGELRVPIFDNTQDIAALSQHSLEVLQAHPGTPGYLIRGHGLYTWGATMADCLRHVEAMEFLITCELEMMRFNR